jgi:hypothetical protein
MDGKLALGLLSTLAFATVSGVNAQTKQNTQGNWLAGRGAPIVLSRKRYHPTNFQKVPIFY